MSEASFSRDSVSDFSRLVRVFPCPVPIRNERGEIIDVFQGMIPIPPTCSLYESTMVSQSSTVLPMALDDVYEKYGLLDRSRMDRRRSLDPAKLKAMLAEEERQMEGRSSPGQRRDSLDSLSSRGGVRGSLTPSDVLGRRATMGSAGLNTSESFGSLSLGAHSEEDAVRSHRINVARRIRDNAVLEIKRTGGLQSAAGGGGGATLADRSEWQARALQRNPHIADLRERVLPLQRAIGFGSLYDAGSTFVKQVLNNEVIAQLIMHHLNELGMRNSRRALEEESHVRFTPMEGVGNLLLIHLRRALLLSERVYDIVMGDKPFWLYQLCSQDTPTTGGPTTSSILARQERRQALGIATKEQSPHMRLLDTLLGQLGFDDAEEDLEEAQTADDISFWDEMRRTDIINQEFERENGHVEAASLNRLVDKLTDNSPGHKTFVQLFLSTFPTFVTPEKLLHKLFQCYEVPPDMGMEPTKVQMLQLRVCNVIKQWMESDFSVFNQKLLSRLEEFMKQHSATDPKLRAYSKSLGAIIQRKLTEEEGPVHRYHPKNPPEPKVPPNFFMEFHWYDICDEELARQLTLADFSVYQKLLPAEFLNMAWTKPKLRYRCPNLMDFMNRFNNVALWVHAMIVEPEGLEDRVIRFTKFIRIQKFLYELHNLFGVLALANAFEMMGTFRLEHTKKRIPEDLLQFKDEMFKLMDSRRKFSNYRAVFATVKAPCVPFLGPFQGDLNETEEKLSSTVESQHGVRLIHWRKRRLVGETIHKMLAFQEVPYDLLPVYQIQRVMFDLPGSRPEEEVFEISKAREPRGSKVEDLKP